MTFVFQNGLRLTIDREFLLECFDKFGKWHAAYGATRCSLSDRRSGDEVEISLKEARRIWRSPSGKPAQRLLNAKQETGGGPST